MLCFASNHLNIFTSISKVMYKPIFSLFLFVIISQKIFSQTSGYWLYKNTIPDFVETDWARNPLLTEISFTINGNIYVGSINSLNQYVRETNTFIKKTPLTGVYNFITSFAIGNKGYVLARMIDGTNKIHEYDPSNNSWTAKQKFYGTNASSAANFIINNRHYILHIYINNNIIH